MELKPTRRSVGEFAASTYPSQSLTCGKNHNINFEGGALETRDSKAQRQTSLDTHNGRRSHCKGRIAIHPVEDEKKRISDSPFVPSR